MRSAGSRPFAILAYDRQIVLGQAEVSLKVQTPTDVAARWRVPAEQALDWINSRRGAQFELTGVIAPGQSDAPTDGRGFELGLVLCDGDHCAREQVYVIPHNDDFEFREIALSEAKIPPLLDPPAGVRAGWLDEQLCRYDFLLLLYYRGRW